MRTRAPVIPKDRLRLGQQNEVTAGRVDLLDLLQARHDSHDASGALAACHVLAERRCRMEHGVDQELPHPVCKGWHPLLCQAINIE